MEKKRYKHARICICRKCQGTGTVTQYASEDILHMNPKTVACDLCNCNGRVLVDSVTTTTIKPLQYGKDYLIKYSAELLEAAVQISVMLNELKDQLPTNDSFIRRVDMLNIVINKSLENIK
ncbi:hypothetical protein [uncultured Bacteroides sp.]|uniref:hypothetical protein n=1 Tax=uncultured Bacteroides sp. TaxID=162156 RepID=UPI002AAC09E1|nr:hypothetical protein [uncultured Bacteroides sp.]